ncbi:Organic solvent tolerance protein [Anaerobiospirillum thomasii]|uniref:LPS-assembly protein LptD n=1 Tax=Anaerobiospirillum thomasii TaxID=179995 RepID=A0A2X0V948_9GAMM|nr:LPS assembly protein LptD [Anaerobiospirillum thomasii]SPT69656.1 Organic solvent tolerance protein [Anaerobiospirillum thomasii]SPT71782.1 Organic solvent tolerance protein [Anaerobiospirillum thomasii]
MNKSVTNSKYIYSALHVALIAILSFSAQSFAASTYVLKNQTVADFDKNEKATALANSIYMTMQRQSSRRFLLNKHVADSSLLPAKLMHIAATNPWQSAPFMPIPQKDMACYYGVPSYKEPVKYDINTEPVTLEADTVYGDIDGNIVYNGNVQITQADNVLSTDRTTYKSKDQTLVSSGNTVYNAGAYTLQTSSPVRSKLDEQQTRLLDVSYQLNGSVASGKSSLIELDNKNSTLHMEDLRFSTCPAGDNSWTIAAGSVDIDKNSDFGSAKDAKLYVGDIPVFYFPYVSFPITSKRKSGLLYPSGSYSSQDGITFSQPIYFNIAPNYDMTFTPQVMGRRGLVLENELRYMPLVGSYGVLRTTYLPNDTSWQQREETGDSARYLIDLVHTSEFFKGDLKFNLDYQQVRSKDYSFIADIGGENLEVTDDHLKRSFKTTYDRENYNINLEVRKYQSLIPDYIVSSRPFSLMPRVEGEFASVYGPFLFSTKTQITRFESSSGSDYHNFDASRIHVEPALEYQILNTRGTTLSAVGKYFYTGYRQDNIEDLPLDIRRLGFNEIDDSVNRNLYMLSVRGKTTFERKILDLRHTQTLEPEFEYRYIPYKNQDNIVNYDTTDRQSDYYANFSYRNFMGIDRIADNNSITAGFTTRILDPHDRELYRMSVAQTYSIVPTRVTLNPNDSPKKYPRSPLSVNFNASPIEQLTIHGAMAYTNETNEISNYNAFLQYQSDSGYMGQISYRFAREGNRTYDNEKSVDLSQVGLQGRIPLGLNMNMVMASYYDLEQSNNIDFKVALSYEQCCYSATIMYEDYTQTNWDVLERKRDRVLGVQFELKGLGAFNISGDDDPKSTDTHLIPYFNPTSLNR